MRNKFLRTISPLVMLMSASALAVPYDDEMGRPAPLSVRRAADHFASLISESSNHRVQAYALHDDYSCCMCCKFAPTPHWILMKNTSKPSVIHGWKHYTYEGAVELAIAKKADRDIREFKPVLARVLNENVVRPYGYEGDLQIKLQWELWSDGHFRVSEPVEATIMHIVNGLGGWKI